MENPKSENLTLGTEPKLENPTVGKPHSGKTSLINNKEEDKERIKEIIENYERHKITLRIVDDKYVNDSSTPNNYVEEVFYVAIDDGQPELRLNNANGQFVGNEFTISGIATDGNGIECVTLQSEGGNVYSTLGIGSGLENGNFSYTFRLNELATKDPIIVTAVDIIGNASTTTFTYRVDSTPPTVNFDRNEVGYVDGDSPNLKLQGYAIDGEKSGDDNDVSKIDQVRVKIGSPVTHDRRGTDVLNGCIRRVVVPPVIAHVLRKPAAHV